MNRFFRTAWATSLACLVLALITALSTGVQMPFLSFSCLLLGLLIALLPNVLQKPEEKQLLFLLLGAAAAGLGFVPILLMRCPTFHYISHALSVMTAAFFFVRLRHNTTYNSFRARFSLVNALLAILTVYVIMMASMRHQLYSSVSSSYFLNGAFAKAALDSMLAYLIVLLACGILCLRGLRAKRGLANERAFQRRQLRDALLFVAAVSVVLSVLPLLAPVWESFLDGVLVPFAQKLGRMLGGAASAAATPSGNYSGLPRPAAETLAQAEPMETVSAVGQAVGGSVGSHSPSPVRPESDAPVWMGLMLVLLAAAIGIAVLFFIRTLRRSKQYDRGYPNEIREKLPESEEQKKEEKPQKRSTDPRKRMRYLYAEFLRHLGRLPRQQSDPAAVPMGTFDRKSRKRSRSGKAGSDSARVYQTSTCGEIRESAEARTRVREEDLAEFTALYEQARYRLGEEPTGEEAARMAELFGTIKQSL